MGISTAKRTIIISYNGRSKDVFHSIQQVGFHGFTRLDASSVSLGLSSPVRSNALLGRFRGLGLEVSGDSGSGNGGNGSVWSPENRRMDDPIDLWS